MQQQEKHRSTLTKALSNLPVHQAPEGIWEGITSDLETLPQITPLQQLPVHAAPERSWPSIEAELDKPGLGYGWRPRLLLAACISLLLMSIFLDRDQGPILPAQQEQAALQRNITPLPIFVPGTPAQMEDSLALQTQRLMSCLSLLPLHKATELHQRLATYHLLAAKQDSLMRIWEAAPQDTTLRVIAQQFYEERGILYQQLVETYCP